MSARDGSSSSSHSEEEAEEGAAGRSLGGGGGEPAWTPDLYSCSSSLRAVVRIKQKYQALKKRRLETTLGGGLAGAPLRTGPKIFTFDRQASGFSAAAPQKRKRRRRRRVLFPSDRRRRAPPPPPDGSRVKNCLYLLCAIVFLQVYNAIENLDDHVLRYDLEGLEKTLRREVFGQQGAVEALLSRLRDYLSTYVHNKPLVMSLHGPGGVGKSHLGRLLAAHFRSVVGDPLVLQYYVLHRCPPEADAPRCAGNLSAAVAGVAERAEEEEKIPLFLFDEAERMPDQMLDALSALVRSKRSNEYLNAIYLFLSDLGHEHIARHVLRNSSAAGRHADLAGEVTPLLRAALERRHPLWAEADLLLLGLLEKSHVMQCFLDEMSREGFYPDRTSVERLAGDVDYYPPVGGRLYARKGCKQVVAKVNLL